MKIAVLIAGQPRFTKEFDHFFENLKNYDQLDFFFYLWTARPADSKFIPPSWPLDKELVKEKLINTLPCYCNVARLEINDQPGYTVPDTIQRNPWSNPFNMWYNSYSIKQANLLREQHNVEYDLVIRARADMGLNTPVDIKHIHNFIMENPNSLVLPDNHRNGLGVVCNDMFAIGKSETISIYCNAVDNFELYHSQGVPYHPETLLGHHLNTNKIAYPLIGIQLISREYQEPKGCANPIVIDHGRWL